MLSADRVFVVDWLHALCCLHSAASLVPRMWSAAPP
ncbi:hypothetical protein ACFY2M_34610 [Streptomyces sp. NPDC001276]